MTKLKYSIIFLFWADCVSAQNSFKMNSEKPSETKTEYASNIKASYLGTILYPGFKIGIERPYKEIIKTKKKGKVLDKDWLWSLNAGFYHHPTFHTNTFLIAERIKRRTNAKGFFMESSPGIGVCRTFLEGTTYNVDETGNTSIKKGAGYTYAMVSLAGAIGKDLSVKNNKPVSIFMKPSLMLMLPYNGFVYARPALEIGLIYKPEGFLESNVKRIIKSTNR